MQVLGPTADFLNQRQGGAQESEVRSSRTIVITEGKWVGGWGTGHTELNPKDKEQIWQRAEEHCSLQRDRNSKFRNRAELGRSDEGAGEEDRRAQAHPQAL